MHIGTIAIHVGQEPDPQTGAVVFPVYQTSTYAQSAPGKHKGYDYSRTANPTRDRLQKAVAALEDGKFGLAFSSGLAATATLMTLFRTGDHFVCLDDVYGGTYRLFEKVFRPWGMHFDFVDARNPREVERALRPNTKMVWVESPSNPLLKLVDIAVLAEICRKRKVLLAVDNTFMSPCFQRPLHLGADIVVHSATKYLGGHSDVVGGAVVTNRPEVYERVKFSQNAIGAVPAPWDCWLVLRGIKTLALRMRQHEKNAMEIARFLEGHRRVARVIYPGLRSHPQHALARRQMTGFGGMLSFEVKGGMGAARKMISRAKLFTLGESLGAVESLIELPAIMTHASIPAERRRELGIADGLIRISAGAEDSGDLVADLKQALA